LKRRSLTIRLRGDALLDGPSHRPHGQPRDPMSGNPNELDTSLRSDVAKSPGYSMIVQDAHTFPDADGQTWREAMST
jgi:hypothetical protein